MQPAFRTWGSTPVSEQMFMIAADVDLHAASQHQGSVFERSVVDQVIHLRTLEHGIGHALLGGNGVDGKHRSVVKAQFHTGGVHVVRAAQNPVHSPSSSFKISRYSGFAACFQSKTRWLQNGYKKSEESVDEMKYVDYLDKKQTESAYYRRMSMPET